MLEGEADLARVTRVHCALVTRALSGLVSAGADPQDLLVVGAQCRDVWSQALGRADPVRRTHDVDVGIAVRRHDGFDDLVSGLERIGDTGIQFRIDGLPVDLMPFGPEIENPPGRVSPPGRTGEDFSVFGFDDVDAASVAWTFASGLTVRLASVADLLVLKVAAWHDRVAWGETKDGVDLAEILRWYVDSSMLEDALYAADPPGALAATDFDSAAAAVLTAGRQARALLRPTGVALLARMWVDSRAGLPAVAASTRHLGDRGRTGELLAWFGAGLTDTS